jgi:hypothetical protein
MTRVCFFQYEVIVSDCIPVKPEPQRASLTWLLVGLRRNGISTEPTFCFARLLFHIVKPKMIVVMMLKIDKMSANVIVIVMFKAFLALLLSDDKEEGSSVLPNFGAASCKELKAAKSNFV